MSTPSLQAVPITELEAAIGALNVAAADAAIGDARACKVPLAYVTVQGQPGATPGSIRIRSGAYVSPNILVTEAPRRVPMPFPAAYPVGRGIISIEGAAQNLSIWLSPSWHAPSLNGTSPISVVWKPGKAC